MVRSEIQLERIWLARLMQEWRKINVRQLDGALKPPVFRIGEGLHTLGTFQPGTRTLSISREHILSAPWTEVLDTLVHEMAHQVVAEYWEKKGVAPHGPEFRKALDLLGARREISSSGSAAKVMARVEKLLSLAQSDNVHEAETAMSMANTLLLKHNIREVNQPSEYKRSCLGGVRKRIPMAWKMIGGLLAEFFFVECIWVNVFVAERGEEMRQLEVLGTPGNVAMAGYVHDFLHQSLGRISRNRAKNGLSAGRTFQCGVILGFRDTLTRRQVTHQEEGLVWSGDPGLNAYFKDQHPRTASLRGKGIRKDNNLEAGKKEGNRLILRRPMTRSKAGDPALLQK